MQTKHDCIALTDNLLSPKTDFQESPVDNPDFTLFTDSLYLQGPHGTYQAGYAAVSPMSILENGHLPNVSPARQAELIALTRACQLQKENLSISTKDSHYAFGVAYGFGILRKQRGFLTSFRTAYQTKMGNQQWSLRCNSATKCAGYY